jgi:hypothetical protein
MKLIVAVRNFANVPKIRVPPTLETIHCISKHKGKPVNSVQGNTRS